MNEKINKLPPSRRKEIEYAESYSESKRMLDKVAKSISTKVSYGKACRLLGGFTKKTPTEIVAEYKADARGSLYECFDKWERIFDDFAIFLEKNFGSATAHLYHSGAKALINCNVPRSARLQARSPEVHSREITPVNFEDLKKIYGMANVRDRAIIAFFKDSGISAREVVGLNIGDLEGFGKNETWIRIAVYREKEHVNYETFLGPNTVKALRAYVEVRKRKGEKVTDNSPVFITENKPFRRLDLHALRANLQQISKKTGIVVSTHRLRKFFETYMAIGKVHPIVLKYWMGHKIKSGRDVEARYIIPPTPEQIKMYKEAYRNIDLARADTAEREAAIAAIPEAVRKELKRLGVTMMRKGEKKDG